MTRGRHDEAATRARSRAALARHRARVRRTRLIYFGVVGAIVIALAVTTIFVWAGGEASHASLRTVAAPPPSLAVESPSATAHLAWRTSDRMALGTPQAGGTVITYSKHAVGGRDAANGHPTWTYTRTDRTVCAAIQVSGVTIGVYANHGNCDQLDAFDSGTGRRKWTRTLDLDGKPLNGTPSYQIQPSSVMLSSDTTIYTVDPGSGLDRWEYFRYGCRINRALLGTAGALISQTCDGRVRCAGIKFCAVGPQLLLRDGSAGTADNGDNRDKILWLRKGESAVPASADATLSALAPDGMLSVLRAKDGSTQLQMPLGAGDTTTIALALDTVELIWRGGKTFAVEPGHDLPVWTAATSGPLTAVANQGGSLSVINARLTAPVSGKVADLDAVTGRVNRTFAVPAPQGATVYPFGDGFLVGAGSGTSVYR